MKVKPVKRFKRDLDNCLFCASCVSNCAAYRGVGWESYSARGKVLLLKSNLLGWFQDEAGLTDRLYTCTMCRACDEACDSDVGPSMIIHAGRVEVFKAGRTPESIQKMLESVNKNANPMQLAREARDAWQVDNADRLDTSSKTLLYAGCYAAFNRRADLAKILKLLNAAGIRPTAMPNESCCGLVSYQVGDVNGAEALMKANIAWAREHGIEEIVFFCPSCFAYFRELYAQADKEFKPVLRMYYEILPREGAELPLVDLTGRVLTYHDPCHLGRYSRQFDIHRELIRQTGATLVEMDRARENASCCGGGGGLLAYNSDLGLRIAEERIKDVLDTGAEAVVTPCFTCVDTLEGAAFRVDEAMNRDLEVWNLLEIFRDVD